MFDTLIWIVYTYIHHSHPREARRNFCIVRLTSFVVFQSILSIHTITPISSARSAEKYEIVLRIPYYFILCTHIITPLLFRAERRDKMLCITYYIQDINTCSVSYFIQVNTTFPSARSAEKNLLYIITRGRNIILGR